MCRVRDAASHAMRSLAPAQYRVIEGLVWHHMRCVSPGARLGQVASRPKVRSYRRSICSLLCFHQTYSLKLLRHITAA